MDDATRWIDFLYCMLCNLPFFYVFDIRMVIIFNYSIGPFVCLPCFPKSEFPLHASIGLDAGGLLCNQKNTALFGATPEFSLPP